MNPRGRCPGDLHQTGQTDAAEHHDDGECRPIAGVMAAEIQSAVVAPLCDCQGAREQPALAALGATAA